MIIDKQRKISHKHPLAGNKAVWLSSFYQTFENPFRGFSKIETGPIRFQIQLFWTEWKLFLVHGLQELGFWLIISSWVQPIDNLER